MNWKSICNLFGNYLLLFSLLLCVPLIVDLYYLWGERAAHPQPFAWDAFIGSSVITAISGGVLKVIGYGKKEQVYRREGLFLVAIIWMVSGIFGGLPYLLSNTLDKPVDAYFEAISGFTTTGASVIAAKKYDDQGKEVPYQYTFSKEPPLTYTFYGTVDSITVDNHTYQGVEAVSKSLLFWRSFTQWLGGMGIVVLFVAILPALGVGGKRLFQAEVPGPVKDGITPRIRHTASLLWKLYIVLSVLQVSLLMFTNEALSLYEAVTITFSTISTGGFCIKGASIAGFQSSATEWVIIAFMLVGSINFSLYYFLIRGQIYRIFQKELIVYLLVVVCGALFCFWQLSGWTVQPLSGGERTLEAGSALRTSAFQYISMLTSTGFATTNYDLWPYVVQVFLVLAMFVGSMAGSTGGGIKIARHIIVLDVIRSKVQSIFSPEKVHSVRGVDRTAHQEVAQTVLSYVILILVIALIGTFLLVLDGIDPNTAFTMNACMLNNIGASFGMAGPTDSFAFMSPLAKLFCTFLMVLGRLELFALLVLLSPSFWRFR